MFCRRPPFLLLLIFPFSCLRQLRRDSISTQRRKERINNSKLAPEARHTSLHLHIPSPHMPSPFTCLRLSTEGMVLFHTMTVDMLHKTKNNTHSQQTIFRCLFLEIIHTEDMRMNSDIVTNVHPSSLQSYFTGESPGAEMSQHHHMLVQSWAALPLELLGPHTSL